MDFIIEENFDQKNKNDRFRKWNIFVCLFLSGIIAILSFIYLGEDYYSISGGNPSIVLSKLPIFIIFNVLKIIHLDGVIMLIGFSAKIFVPIISFIFWFLIFYYQIILVDRKTKSEKMLPSFGYIIPICITLFICYSVIFFGSSDNKIEACISGKYKMNAGFGPLGPSSCMRVLLEEKVNSEKTTANEIINMCLNLSDVKRVNAFNEQFPVEYETYQEYCLDEVFSVIVDKFGPDGPVNDLDKKFLGSSFSIDNLKYIDTKRFDYNFINTIIAKQLCGEVGFRTNSEEKNKRCLEIVGLNSDINYFKSGKVVSKQFPSYNGQNSENK
jgi:hypothetical protein